jgi:hypothetical protein
MKFIYMRVLPNNIDEFPDWLENVFLRDFFCSDNSSRWLCIRCKRGHYQGEAPSPADFQKLCGYHKR